MSNQQAPKVALFPGSFDPFTAGHEDIVRRALQLFDRVVVAVGVNPSKHGLMATEQRVRLIERVFCNEPRVEVSRYEGLTVDECRRVGARWIVRGVRGGVDFEMERTNAMVNAEVAPEVETLMMCTRSELEIVSSSVVRELLRFGGDVSKFMPRGIDIKEYLNNL
ncbi:MAG: pantetheine-phosphate adenylyltransferase [Rikenellaceae bacterium]|nr:pantetheine-phosphate adenylyltransferase [Rikenellaceae bacterium]